MIILRRLVLLKDLSSLDYIIFNIDIDILKCNEKNAEAYLIILETYLERKKLPYQSLIDWKQLNLNEEERDNIIE